MTTSSHADWTPLFGVEVTITPADAPSWRGVVLPPDARTTPGWLRVAVTTRPGPPPALGELTEVDPARCAIDPMPDRVEQRYLPSQRLTRGPKGLPLYRSDNLPAAAVASRSTLRRQFRRVPAANQQPVAEYYQVRDYTDLYAIADATPLPDLSPARQAAWTNARTCARCGAHHADPVRVSPFGERYCPNCLEPEARDRWTAARQVEREQTTRWARDVLASDALWLYSEWGLVTPLYAARIDDGAVLVDLPAVTLAADEVLADVDPEAVAPWKRLPDIKHFVQQLVGHRLIAWERDARAILENLHRRDVPGVNPQDLDESDVFRSRYARWLALPRAETPRFSPHQPPALMTVVRPPSGHYQHEEAITVLREMAAGDPSPERLESARARQAPHDRISTDYRSLPQVEPGS